MQSKKIVISLLLLLSYTLGFAHNLMPHNVFNSNDSKHCHEHVNVDDSNTEDYILHGNHFDASLYDLIVCSLSDSQHTDENCNLEHYIAPNTFSSAKNLVTVQFVTLLFTLISEEIIDETKAIYDTNIHLNFSFPSLEHSPHRGPPITSC